jgi:hypothetical protein
MTFAKELHLSPKDENLSVGQALSVPDGSRA